ncbi:ABC transporter permease subunit [Sulfolobus acidocaldarius]|nr:ABC transporter permease subunit [Sulfolobus acidocaldarius]
MFITSVVPNGTITCNVTYGGKTVTLISFLISSVTTTDYALSSGTVTYSSYSSYSGETRSRGGLVVGTSETMYSTPSSIVASYAVTGNKELIVASNVYGSNLKLYVGFMNSMPSNVTLNISSLPNYVKLTYVGTVNSYINTYDIGNLNANGSYIVVEILNSSSTNTGNTGSSSGSFGFSRFYPYGYVTDYVITTTYAQLLPFSFIFPIMMLYLSYAIFAKPRDSGALKFLLARPVTRRDVFINRYISGVLTALIIAIVFSLVSLVTIELIIGARIPLIPILPISLSLFVGLVAFFSLTYLFPTFIKSSGGYLGISIFLFLLFTIGYSIIGAILGLYTNLGIVKAQYVLGYFNPLGIFQFGEYYVDKLIGAGLVSDASGVVILPLVVLSSVLWIAVPLILGYMRFRKVEI